jgi:hypothetical protein
MYGTKSLLEMDLVPSATVPVMMCKERGMVRRGDVEGRCDAAYYIEKSILGTHKPIIRKSS